MSKKAAKTEVQEKSWKTILNLEGYMVVDISDCGLNEVHTSEGIDADDLRSVIHLFGGGMIVLDGNFRIILSSTGWEIQELVQY